MELVEIVCRCKDCTHSEQKGHIRYCWFWDYEQGMSPNKVDDDDFCSNADKEVF